jgi:hypothetical protein
MILLLGCSIGDVRAMRCMPHHSRTRTRIINYVAGNAETIVIAIPIGYDDSRIDRREKIL